MATDAQLSGPLPGSKFTQARWVQIFGAESGIHGDTDGSAFSLTLPPASDTVEVGSPTVDSTAIVGGFPLIIPKGLTQSLTIPASTNASVGRTDIICARLDTANFTTGVGPVRLHRIAGTEGSANLPSYDAAPPSPDTEALWAITRKSGQSLNQATVRDLRTWTGPNSTTATGGLLPQSAPLGSRAEREGIIYRRDMVGSSAQWVEERRPARVITGSGFVNGSAYPGWSQQSTQRLALDGTMLWVHIEVVKSGGQIIASSAGSLGDNTNILTLDAEWKPHNDIAGFGYVTSDAGVYRNAGARMNANGVVQATSTQPGASIRRFTADFVYSIAPVA